MAKKPTIYIGTDHAGFELKESLIPYLKRTGFSVEDLSPVFQEGDDYPAAALAVAQKVKKYPGSLGLLVCGTGHGMEIAANRMKNIRAIVARDEKDAKLAREHNHANIIVFGSRMTTPAKAKRVLQTWLKAKPSTATRHVRRVRQLDA